MTDLKMKTETVHTVDYNDLEQFVNKAYNTKTWSFAADQESGNDSSHRFTVEPVSAYDNEWTGKEMDDFLDKGYSTFFAADLLNDMCERGLIPAGDYIVEVCW